MGRTNAQYEIQSGTAKMFWSPSRARSPRPERAPDQLSQVFSLKYRGKNGNSSLTRIGVGTGIAVQ